MAKKNCTFVSPFPEGNAYGVMEFVKLMMQGCGYSKKDIDAYLEDAKSSDYDHLLAVSFDMVRKCDKRYEQMEQQQMQQDDAELDELFNVVSSD